MRPICRRPLNSCCFSWARYCCWSIVRGYFRYCRFWRSSMPGIWGCSFFSHPLRLRLLCRQPKPRQSRRFMCTHVGNRLPNVCGVRCLTLTFVTLSGNNRRLLVSPNCWALFYPERLSRQSCVSPCSLSVTVAWNRLFPEWFLISHG